MDPATRKFPRTPIIMLDGMSLKTVLEAGINNEPDPDRIPGTHAINLMARAFNAMPAFSDLERRAECWKTSK